MDTQTRLHSPLLCHDMDTWPYLHWQKYTNVYRLHCFVIHEKYPFGKWGNTLISVNKCHCCNNKNDALLHIPGKYCIHERQSDESTETHLHYIKTERHLILYPPGKYCIRETVRQGFARGDKVPVWCWGDFTQSGKGCYVAFRPKYFEKCAWRSIASWYPCTHPWFLICQVALVKSDLVNIKRWNRIRRTLQSFQSNWSPKLSIHFPFQVDIFKMTWRGVMWLGWEFEHQH